MENVLNGPALKDSPPQLLGAETEAVWRALNLSAPGPGPHRDTPQPQRPRLAPGAWAPGRTARQTSKLGTSM